MAKCELEVSVEAVIYKAMRHVAEMAYEKHGLKVVEARFDWDDIFTGTAEGDDGSLSVLRTATVTVSRKD